MNCVGNGLENCYAMPMDHPVTCANPAPWKIVEYKLDANPFKVFIRGDDSMWFRADQCHIGTKGELLDIQKLDAVKKACKLFTRIVWMET